MTEMMAPHRSQQEMELAAFEKGRIQGEMEATRRIEAEGHMQQKQLLPDQMAMQQQTQLQRPDVVEINRLTWLQRAAFVLGEMATIAQLVLTIVWLEEYRDSVSWADGDNGGDNSFYNTHFLCASLGVFFLAQAITHYRVFPINLNPNINRFWYVFLQAASIITFTMALVSLARSNPGTESDFWSVSQWCFALGYAVFVLHALYSIVSTLLEMTHHRKAKGDYNNWSETGTHMETPEQKRDHSAYNHLARTVYAPAPHGISRVITGAKNAAAAHGTTHGAHGAQSNVPTAPANAPRWAETPNTHSEDYWLLPRAKWAVVGFWAIGTGFLMQLAAWQQVRATGRQSWAQDGVPLENLSPISERSRQMEVVGALGFLLLLSLACMSYVAMPPRTAIVKNGVLVDPNARRSSISHNAETRLGQGHNVV